MTLDALLGVCLAWWCLLLPPQVVAEEYCFSRDARPYPYFAAKTAYEVVHGKKEIRPVKNCEPVLVWSLNRHAIRYPAEYKIERESNLKSTRDSILRNHHELKSGRLCNDDLKLLRDWTYNITVSDANEVTSEGAREIRHLARRLKGYFSPLDAPYSPDRFKISFTAKNRTRTSAEAFTGGLFGEDIQLPESLENDSLLEPFRDCSGWNQSVDAAEGHFRSFNEGRLMKELIASVSRRLGFNKNLTYGKVQGMYDACRYTKAFYPDNLSPWCVVFTKEHLKILEYSEDLMYYYQSGYGNPFTSKLGCRLVADMINTLRQGTRANNSEPTPPATLYFAHSTTQRTFLVSLGIAQDQVPLTPENYQEQTRREWRTTKLTPFAANFVAVLYKCTDDFKVKFYLNEHIVDLKGCDSGLCDWSYIYERFGPNLIPAICNRDFCGTNS